MKQTILNLYKKSGETPLERINRFRIEEMEYLEEKLSFAGRLDPLAEGVLLVVVGEENKKKEAYLGLRKEYLFDVLFGFSTDTYDVLGKVTSASTRFSALDSKIETFVRNFEKQFLQTYPPYSSKTVKGKALFDWAKEGKLSEIEMPQKLVEIYSLEIVDSFFIKAADLKINIFDSIASVKGDFRQAEIIKLWQRYFDRIDPSLELPVYRLKISCSTGTYVRSLANEMGKHTEAGALALRIVRTKVGEHDIEDSLL